MRHRIKKIPNLSTLFNHASDGQSLLHSDKSTYTYFYKKLSYSGLWFQTIPLGLFAFALLLVLCLMIYPIGMSEKTYAATTVPDPNFSIELSIGDTLQSEEEVEAGVVGYIANNFTVSTTSAESYSIYLTPDTENGYTNNLIGRDYKDTITGVGTNVSVSDFGRNTWGYGITNANDTTTANSALTYSTIPDGSKPIKTVSNPDDGNDTYRLVFAAKINDDKPADHYQSQAVLSVVGSPKNIVIDSVSTWNELRYMQQMTTQACTNASIGASKTLIDSRDQKTYWVTKMSDGQCWMTQNLDLDLSAVKPLTPDDSNVTVSWTPPENTQTSASPNFGTSNNIIKSWDPGYAYYANGTTKTTTGVDESWAKDTSGTNLNTHYLQGNYYSWVAAMAGNTTGNTSNNDICPKGWQLPLSNNGTTAKTFQALTNALGATSGTSTGSSDSKLLTSPGYFVRGGRVSTASLGLAGSYGSYWSSVPTGTNSAYFLSFYGDGVYPSSNFDRYYGMSVRCVAK